MIAALHTWGSNLSLHPHLHCIVPAGGLDGDGQWKDCKKGGHLFVRFGEISAMFRRYYLDFLVQCWEEGRLDFGSDPAVQALAGQTAMTAFILQLQQKKWNLRIERPMSGVQQVVNYLGRYIYRTAIANGRILEITEKTVRFTVKDYAASTDTTKPAVEKELELAGVEFLRRFVQHILPPSFQRVRYYGFYAGAAKTKLDNARKKIGNRDWCYTVRTVVQIITAMIGCEPDVCPCCGARGQWLVEILPAPYRRKPPVVAAQRGPPAGPGFVSGGVSVP